MKLIIKARFNNNSLETENNLETRKRSTASRNEQSKLDK